MGEPRSYRLDDVRRFAAALAKAIGVAPARASSLASHLVWFDECVEPAHGVARLPLLLERIESGRVDVKAEGRVSLERNGTAVFDAQNGLPPLALARAGEIATEKARDAGIGLVVIRNVGDAGPSAAVVSEMAIGPFASAVIGPGSSVLAVALPSPEGIPAVFDSALATEKGRAKELEALAEPWASVLMPDGGRLVVAASVSAIESLAAFHLRVAETIKGLGEADGRLLPARVETYRREARTRGVMIPGKDWKALTHWAKRLGVDPPRPMAG